MGKPLTTEQFIEKAIKVHGNLYCYDKSDYVNTYTKVEILCPEHGLFWQTPKDHLKGRGCRKCGFIKCTACAIKSTEQVVKEFIQIHKNKYDYSKVKYEKDNIKVKIICPIHGGFEQIPSSHLQGCGCPKCGKIKASEKRSHSFEHFVKQAKEVHGDLYRYNKETYKSYKQHTDIMCSKCKSTFKTTPQHHTNGTGCPNCAESGFNKNKPAILYYLKITTDKGLILYKIGITNRSVNERFQLTDLSKIEIIKQEKFALGSDALDKETEIKRKFKEFQYKGPAVLSSGNTELFTKDILAQT